MPIIIRYFEQHSSAESAGNINGQHLRKLVPGDGGPSVPCDRQT